MASKFTQDDIRKAKAALEVLGDLVADSEQPCSSRSLSRSRDTQPPGQSGSGISYSSTTTTSSPDESKSKEGKRMKTICCRDNS